MTRGNQRELARAKAQKKQEQYSKKKGSGGTEGNKGTSLEDRKHRDAEKMRLKQQAADEKKAGGAAGGKS